MKSGAQVTGAGVRRLATVVAGLALVVGLAGCISSDDIPAIPIIPGVSAPPAELFGTWHYATVTVDGQPQDLAEWLEWQAETATARLVIDDDYSQRYEERDAQGDAVNILAGHYAVDDGLITLTVTAQNGSAVNAYTAMTALWQIDGDTLTLTEAGDGYTAVAALIR